MPALEPNSLILVTGATGYIGSHVVDQALALGHRVRATARNQEKADQITDYYKTKDVGSDRLEVVLVNDFIKSGAWDAAVKGVDGVAHLATILTFSDKYEDVVPPTITGVTEMLESAAKEASVKRVVLTSSTIAAYNELQGSSVPSHADTSMWNEEAVEQAKTSPNPINVYAASKVLGEQAAWEYVKTHNVGFDLVTVLPGATFGPFLPSGSNQSTGGFIMATQQGSADYVNTFVPQWSVDVRDVAKVHVVALSAEKHSERILSVSGHFSWDRVIDAINSTSHKTTVQKPEEQDTTYLDLDISRFEELLAPYGGFTSLEQTITDMFV